jgi:hypothetical protein
MGHWWRGVLGLVLPSMVAPVAWTTGIRRVLVPATHTGEFGLPHGTRPGLDDRVTFFGVEVVHDGFESSRHDKLRLLTTSVPGQPLLVCVPGIARGSGNCMRCIKCLRTIVGLAAIDADASDHGFRVDARSFRRTRRMLESGRGFDFNEHEQFFWEDVQREAVGRHSGGPPGADEFFDWLSQVDIPSLRAASGGDPLRRTRRLIGRFVPARLRPLARRWYLRIFRRW